MTAPSTGWKAPPECPGCGRCVRRATANRNGGYCSTCRPLGASPVRALGDAIDLTEWQQLAASRGAEDRRRQAERDARRRRRRG